MRVGMGAAVFVAVRVVHGGLRGKELELTNG